MSEVSVLVAARRDGPMVGDAVEDVIVRWDGAARGLPAEAMAYLEERWAEYAAAARAQDQTLFNGPVTQLLGARRLKDGKVELTLGPSDYKTFLVTCLRDRAWFEAHAPEGIVRALGNSVLLTHGDEALLGIRSAKVSAYANRAHLIGGVLDLLGPEGNFPATALGLVDHLRLELEEEAHVAPEDLVEAGWPRLLEVARDEYLGQPEALWQWETRGPLEEIGSRLDLSEHAGWIVVSRGGVRGDVWERMTPEAREVWRVWGKIKG